MAQRPARGIHPWRKAAGILVEGLADGAAVIGMGVNVDWRGVDRPEALVAATSLAEVAGHPVDRWRLLAGVVGLFTRRYAAWQELPAGFLDGYRARCATIGRAVRVTRVERPALEGTATAVDATGALVIRTPRRHDRGRRGG